METNNYANKMKSLPKIHALDIKMLYYDYMTLTVSDPSLEEQKTAEMPAWVTHIMRLFFVNETAVD